MTLDTTADPAQQEESAEIEQSHVDTSASTDAPGGAEMGEDAGMAEGFASANDPDAGRPAEVPEPTVEDPAAAEKAEEANAALRKQLDYSTQIESMRRTQDKLNGTVGAMRQQIEQFKKPAVQAVKLSPDAFKRLAADYPDLAQILAEDLNEKIFASREEPTATPEQLAQLIDQKVSERVQQEQQKAIPRTLIALGHKDFQQVVSSPEFEAYKQTLPDDDRARLDASWDAYEIGDAITAFKATQEAQRKAAAQKQNRLKNAITPQGAGTSGQATMTEEQAMAAGFKAVRA